MSEALTVEPAVSVHVDLPEEFTIDQAKAALLAMADAVNRMVGLALAHGALTAMSPVVQTALTAAGHLEQTATIISQQQQQAQANSGIIQPQMRPIPMGPRRTN